MPDLTNIELTDNAQALGFELICPAETATPSLQPARLELQYSLRNNETRFEGTAQECAVFLTGWAALRSRMLGDLLVAPSQELFPALPCDQDRPSTNPPHGQNRPGPSLAATRALPRDQRQGMISAWAETAFGYEEALGLPQRALRLLEEALELFQACDGNAEIARELVSHVFRQPQGRIGQELGGVAICVLALAAAAGLSADDEECREIHRVLSKPVDEFTRRNAVKSKAGFKISESLPIRPQRMPR